MHNLNITFFSLWGVALVPPWTTPTADFKIQLCSIMFSQVSQKLVPAVVSRSRSTPLTAMMSSLSLSSQHKLLALRSPLNFFCRDYSRQSLDIPSFQPAMAIFRSSSSFQPLSVFRRGTRDAPVAKSLISSSLPAIFKPSSLLQARRFASKKVGSIYHRSSTSSHFLNVSCFLMI